MWTALHMIWWPNVVLAASSIGPRQYTYEVVVSIVSEKMVWAGWFTFAPIPIKVYVVSSTGWCQCEQSYIRYGCPMWCWWPAEIGPRHDTYEIVVSIVSEKMVWAGWFIFATIPNKIYLVSSTGWGRCGQRCIRDGCPMWCWWQAQIGPHHDSYDVFLTALREKMVWAGWFTFAPILSNIYNSVAVVEVDVDSNTYDIEAQCGAGDQLKFYLITTHTRL